MLDRFKYAGFWQRLLAHNIDLIPIIALYYAISFLVKKTEYDYILISGIYFLYHITSEYVTKGVTLGKKWTRLRVTDTQGSNPSFTKVLLRNISKVLSLLIFFSGFVLIAFDSKKRGLHDYIGSTLVIFDED